MEESDTLMTGGGERKSLLFSVKSSTRSVADMMISFMGKPFCERQIALQSRRTHSLNLAFERVRARYLVAEGDDARQETDEDIGVHAALMSFVYDDHAVFLQQEILQKEKGNASFMSKQQCRLTFSSIVH